MLVGPLAERGHETELVECRWSQSVDQPAYLGDLVPCLLGQLPDEVGRLGRVLGDQVAGGVEPHRHRGQRRPEPVVQVATHAAPLLLAGRDQVLPRQLELAVDGDRLGQRTDLAADVLQQPPVAGPERVATRVDLES